MRKIRQLLLIFVLVFSCLLIAGCSRERLNEKKIRDILEKENSSSEKLVNTVTFASNKANVGNLEIRIDSEEVTLGDYTATIQGYYNKQIIGYYDESGQTYYFYRLVTDYYGVNSVWQFAASKDDNFGDIGWVKAMVENPTELVLVRFNKTTDVSDDDFREYKVYAIANNKLKLLG